MSYCCLCKVEITPDMDANNPAPLGKNISAAGAEISGDVCCNHCNITKVLPARIAQNKDQFQEQKQELEDSMIASDYGTMITREMEKIREEWLPWKEEGTTDTHKVVYEAEKRVKKMGKKDIYKYDKKEEYNSGNVNFLKEGKFIMCSKCLDNTPHIPAWGICQRCGTQYTTSLKV